MLTRKALACALLLAAPIGAQSLPPQVVTRAGTQSTSVVNVQGNSSGTPIPVTGTLSVSGAADTVGNAATFNGNSVCATVLLTGQPGAGFALQAGTLDGTLTPGVSEDATPASPGCTGGHYTATKFVVDAGGNTASTLVVTSPNVYTHYGVVTLSGSRCARVCTTVFNSGSATGNLLASVAPSPPPAAGADVTDRAGRLLGVTYGSDGNKLATANTGRLQVDIVTGGGSNASVAATGGAVPASGTYAGMNVGGNLTGMSGGHGTAAGALRVELPTDGTGIVGLAAGSNVVGHVIADSGSTTAVTGNVTAIQGTGSNLHTVVDSGTVTTSGTATVSQATGTNLHAVIDSGSTTAVTQATGTNLHAVVDSGAVTVSGTVTTTPPANASTNLAQVSGTTADVNSGVKSAGTLRVVLATDQPALTNKLLVTPDANSAVNVAQVAGTTADTNSGVKSAGTLRVVLATDQPALTNKLLVTPDSVALPANQSVNVAQVNGVTTTMGNGISGTGVQRVTLASDSTGQVALATGSNTIGALTANQSVNTAQVNGVTTQTGAGTAGTGSQRVAVATSDGSTLATANTGRLQVDVISGGGSNASVVTDGSAPPASDTMVAGSVTTSSPTYTTGQAKPLSLDTTGALRVNVTAGGAGGGIVTQSTPANLQATVTGAVVGHGTAATAMRVELPTDGTGVVGLATGSNVIGHVINDSGSTTAVTGNVTAVQGTGSNLHTVVDSGTITVSGTVTTTPPSNASTNVAQFGGNNVVTGTGVSGVGVPRVTVSSDSSTVVTQGTGTNLHAVIDSGSTTAVTQATGTNLHAVIDSGSTTAVTQATGTNLHTVVDSGTITTSGTATVSQATGTNLHAVIDTGSTTAVTQATGTNLHAVIDTGSTTAVTQATGTNLHAVIDSGVVNAANNDGTNTQKVLAASTAPATTDKAAVVALSPTAAPVCTSFIAVSQTASAKVISGASSKKVYICSITLVTDTAQFVNIIEGTGAVCATGGTAIYGSTTAGSGMSFGANGGMAQTSSTPFVVTGTALDDLCVTQSGSGRLSGSISYVIQ